MSEVVPPSVSPSLVPKRKSKFKDANPIETAIKAWLESLPVELVESLGLTAERLLLNAPKRWVVYPPMVLLPSGSFGDSILNLSSSPFEAKHMDALWSRILDKIGKREGKGLLTHVAINAGIPLSKGTNEGENVLRTPSGILMLYGDFGPALPPNRSPTEKDFEEAFWVSTKQNSISQVWAPRYTMFSRGNIKEKARLLDFHKFGDKRRAREELRREAAADLYAGIGYFVFSYVKMGMGTVVGWELNPWSVEGLRRGAVLNGWSVQVVRNGDEWMGGNERIVVFLEDNQRAAVRLRKVELGRVSHVNGGLLPTSEASWKMSLGILEGDGWLHLHENVGVNDIEQRKAEIEDMFRGWLSDKADKREAKVEHVEFVKTFAPGVWHCVFDVYISN